MTQFPGSLVDIEYHLPSKVVTNDEFKTNFPDWRVEQTEKRTGVTERRIALDSETAYDLALIAGKKLFSKHPTLLSKIDAIIFCTQSPDYVMPSNAFLMQKDLGLSSKVLAFDFNLACSGYVYGLLIASGLIKTGIARNILMVTADTYSKFLNQDDRSTRMLFGDGASASWIGDADNEVEPLINSFDDFCCESDGVGWDKFIIKTGGSRNPISKIDTMDQGEKIFMDGLNVLNLVNDRVVKQIYTMLDTHHLKTGDISQFFLHQASGLAIESLRRRLSINETSSFSNLSKIGNTVSSSLPILIKDYFSGHELTPNSKIVLCGFGVGYSWGTILAKK